MVKNSINKPVIFIAVLIIMTILGDTLIGNVLNSLYFSDASIKNERLLAYKQSQKDIIIFGSSRAEAHFDPMIISQITGMSCYNMGFSGQNIYFHKAMLESVLEEYSPKAIVLELLDIDFVKTDAIHDKEKLSVLLPLYAANKHAKQAIQLRGRTEKYKNLSSIYPFNSAVYAILRNNYYPFVNNYNGYIPIHNKWEYAIDSTSDSKSKIDEFKVKAIYDFIEKAQNRNCKVLITVSPYYMIRRDSLFNEISKRIRTRFDLEVFSLSQDRRFLDRRDLFADPMHLNTEGAKQFSEIISAKILKLVATK